MKKCAQTRSVRNFDTFVIILVVNGGGGGQN